MNREVFELVSRLINMFFYVVRLTNKNTQATE